MDEYKFPENYRIVRDGNNTHWVQQLEPKLSFWSLWLFKKMVWVDVGVRKFYYGGDSSWVRLTFKTRKDACDWLREDLEKKSKQEEYERRSKEFYIVGRCP